jgi:hypothetical protein
MPRCLTLLKIAAILALSFEFRGGEREREGERKRVRERDGEREGERLTCFALSCLLN